jgi:hypothetical protein
MMNRIALACALFVFTHTPAYAAVIEVGPGDGIGTVESTMQSLQPGDELVLQGGTYQLGSSRFSFDLVGTQAQPIIIRAKTGEQPHFHRNNANQNIIDIDNAVYVTLRAIEFSGGSAGIRISGADHLTIEDCHLHDTGDVALRANDGGVIYESMHIVGNHIHHTNNTGEGMYLGCNNNGCQFQNAIIEWNYIHHTNGSTISQGDGIEIKEGSFGNTIRDNVIHDTNYPGILVYSTVGNGAPNLIEGNIIWNTNDYSIQAAADATIRNNIILGSSVSFQSHQNGSPSNIEFVHNTLITSGTALYVRNVSGSVLVANNAIYSQSGSAINLVSGSTSLVTVAGNVGGGGLSGGSGGHVDGNGINGDFIDGHYNVPPLDLYPSSSSALIGTGDTQYAVTRDFNGNLRSGTADVGAYAYTTMQNPGWAVTSDFKPQAAAPDTLAPAAPTGLTVIGL